MAITKVFDNPTTPITKEECWSFYRHFILKIDLNYSLGSLLEWRTAAITIIQACVNSSHFDANTMKDFHGTLVFCFYASFTDSLESLNSAVILKRCANFELKFIFDVVEKVRSADNSEHLLTTFFSNELIPRFSLTANEINKICTILAASRKTFEEKLQIVLFLFSKCGEIPVLVDCLLEELPKEMTFEDACAFIKLLIIERTDIDPYTLWFRHKIALQILFKNSFKNMDILPDMVPYSVHAEHLMNSIISVSKFFEVICKVGPISFATNDDPKIQAYALAFLLRLLLQGSVPLNRELLFYQLPILAHFVPPGDALSPATKVWILGLLYRVEIAVENHYLLIQELATNYFYANHADRVLQGMSDIPSERDINHFYLHFSKRYRLFALKEESGVKRSYIAVQLNFQRRKKRFRITTGKAQILERDSFIGAPLFFQKFGVTFKVNENWKEVIQSNLIDMAKKSKVLFLLQKILANSPAGVYE